MAKTKLNSSFFAMQSIGTRDGQEDSYGICYDLGGKGTQALPCFIIADGMGGHTGGNVASQTAIDSVKLVIESSDAFDERTLRDSLSAANSNIAECVKVDSDLQGMGTTLVVLAVIGELAFWISVGDSPLLCLDNNNELHLLNEDHSMRPVLDKLVESGVMDQDHPDYQSKVTQLRSALTGDTIDMYDLNSQGVSLTECKYLILSTDGLDTLSHDEIKAIIISDSNKGSKEIATQLINAIDEKASAKQDNTTLIVIDPLAYITTLR